MKTQYLLLLLAVFAVPVHALNMSAFKDAPFTRLNADEVTAFTSFIMKTLDTGADGVAVEWKAPKTPFTSKITPLNTTADGKRKCRETIIESEAKDRFQRGTYTFCSSGSSKWQITVPGKSAKK